MEYHRWKYLNNRAENSHQPTRQQQRAMRGLHSTGATRRFLSAFTGISPHFRPLRHLLTAEAYSREMTPRFSICDEVTGLSTAA